MNRLEHRCRERGVRLSGKRRLILDILDKFPGHPSVEEIHQNASERDRRISMATVYRTVNALAEAGVLSRVEFGDGRSRYEEADGDPHDHLVDLQTGRVVEFREPEIANLVRATAARLGYQLVNYRLELFAQLQPGDLGFSKEVIRLPPGRMKP